MSRRSDLSPEDRRIWARVTGTVTARQLKKALRVTPGQAEPPPAPPAKAAGRKAAAPAPPVAPSPTPRQPSPLRGRAAPSPMEPRLKRRLDRERDPIDARLDLHGHGRFQAEDALVAFLLTAQARGHRSVLVITGQGRRGGGVIRASITEWLSSPRLRGVVTGHASAHRRHGGDGAVYVRLRAG